jgi:hypothetical protein
MRKLIMPAIVLLLAIVIASCADDASYMPQIEQMKDSIFAAYPNTVASVRIHVDNKTDISIVLGGEVLRKSPEDKRQQMAGDLGKMTLRIFGKDSYLKTGKLVITKDERNSSDTPADGVSSSINLDSLKKAGN